jgi:DNA polymerase-3 subunit gamma/tau
MLYNKYRPTSFADVLGQPAVTQLLQPALAQGRIAHAYLLAGPRGTGKTTVARLIAQTVGASTSDVVEIDAASNRGIDQIRSLRDRAQYQPLDGPYKVFLLDEAHMLTPEAASALLKTLEEPPESVIFILATTRLDAMLPTIVSRCLVYNFRRVDSGSILALLRYVIDQEKLAIPDEVLVFLAAEADGSVRDALSELEAVAGLPNLSVSDIRVARGHAGIDLILGYVLTLATRSLGGAFAILTKVRQGGFSMEAYVKDVVWFLRGLLYLSTGLPFNHPYPQELLDHRYLLTTAEISLILGTIHDYSIRSSSLDTVLESATIQILNMLRDRDLRVPLAEGQLASLEQYIQPGEQF